MRPLKSVTLLLAILCPALQATLIFDQSPPNNHAVDITSFRGADDFTLVQSSTITGINFWYGATLQGDLTSATWAIYSNVSGAPGAQIASATASITSSIDSPFFFASMPVASLNLAVGTYWLEIHSGTSLSDASGPGIDWAFTADNASFVSRFSNSGPPVLITGADSGFQQFAFQLTGTTAPSGVPEPATYALLAVGLGLIALRRRIR